MERKLTSVSYPTCSINFIYIPLFFSDKKFLAFFFKRVRFNNSGRYESSFPYLSLCGRERNYIRCDDRPIVYTHVAEKDGKEVFCYGHAGDLLFNDFQPDKVTMSPQTGRVYHPCHASAGSVGLVQSKLAIEFSRLFKFDNGEDNPPTQFTWQGRTYNLSQNWLNM